MKKLKIGKFLLVWNRAAAKKSLFELWWNELKYGETWNDQTVEASQFVCHLRVGPVVINFLPGGDWWYKIPPGDSVGGSAPTRNNLS